VHYVGQHRLRTYPNVEGDGGRTDSLYFSNVNVEQHFLGPGHEFRVNGVRLELEHSSVETACALWITQTLACLPALSYVHNQRPSTIYVR